MKGDQITPKVWQLDSNKSRAVILYEEENAMPLVGHPSFMHGSKRGLRPEQHEVLATALRDDFDIVPLDDTAALAPTIMPPTASPPPP